MKKYIAWLAAALWLSSVVWAQQKMDRRLPFVVEANEATYTDITQTTVFKGRVILTQGSTRIEADHVETIVDPEGYQYATATMNGAGLVHFKQTRAGTNEILTAQGQKLIYDGRQNLVVLSGQAQMKRLTPQGRLIDKIDADELVYNQLTEVFESHNNPNTHERTRVIITPKTQAK
ncbi:MAG: lipopolysaccharide transport periplasmic protein LptA [Formosimonas sp.]